MLYYLTTNEANLPIGLLNELTIGELGEIISLAQERKKEDYELMALAVQVGYINANNKKKVKMFPKDETSRSHEPSKKITKEEKAADLEFLDGLF